MHQDIHTDSDFSRLDFDVTQAPDRRKTDDEIVDLIRQMFVELKQMRQDLHLHIQDEAAVIKHAFPNDDPNLHRRIHEEQLKFAEARTKKAEAQAAMWDNAKTALFVAGALGLSGFILNLVWEAILKGPKP
jgi:hypothetical protein